MDDTDTIQKVGPRRVRGSGRPYAEPWDPTSPPALLRQRDGSVMSGPWHIDPKGKCPATGLHWPLIRWQPPQGPDEPAYDPNSWPGFPATHPIARLPFLVADLGMEYPLDKLGVKLTPPLAGPVWISAKCLEPLRYMGVPPERRPPNVPLLSPAPRWGPNLAKLLERFASGDWGSHGTARDHALEGNDRDLWRLLLPGKQNAFALEKGSGVIRARYACHSEANISVISVLPGGLEGRPLPKGCRLFVVPGEVAATHGF